MCMKYCKICLIPNTRPNSEFHDGICQGCLAYKKQKTTNWSQRLKELEILCDKYRGCNGDDYDCAIAVSGGKDSHFQVYYMKEVMKMNPVLLGVSNFHGTDVGEKNLENISDTFGCDMIVHVPNKNLTRRLTKIAFEKIGQPTWYIDQLIYAFPVKMALKLKLNLLVYGENTSYTYGGHESVETPSAMNQPLNKVVRPLHDQLIEENLVTPQEMQFSRFVSVDECKSGNLEPIYLSYFVPWNTVHNYEVAKRYGFRDLTHEHTREGTIENYNSIDNLGYLVNQFLKYPKFAQASATEMASRWIRYGLKTREEMIPIVEEKDGKLDQGIVEKFCEFTRISTREFFEVLEKWYNTELFEQDSDGIWHPKFKVGTDFP